VLFDRFSRYTQLYIRNAHCSFFQIDYKLHEELHFSWLIFRRPGFESDRSDASWPILIHHVLHGKVVFISKEALLGLDFYGATSEEERLTKLIHDVQIEHD